MRWARVFPCPYIQNRKKMKRIFNLILIAGVTMLSYSCATTENPTPSEMLPGSWNVVEVFADFQGEGVNVYTQFILERDGSFVLVLEDVNELRRGTWSANGNSITLNSDTGEQIVFSIVFQSFEKMQLDQTLALPSGNLLITYLLNKAGDGSFYSSQGNN